MPLLRFADRFTTLTALDPLGQRLTRWAGRVPVAVRDALHGVWLGHPLHPAVVQLPIGAWTGAVLLDAVAALTPDPATRVGVDRAATFLVGTGLASVPVAALPGAMDAAQLHPEQQRVAIAHAGANVVATTCMAASLVARRRGDRGMARLWAVVGVTAASVGSAIGGHLSFRWAAGANHAEDVPHVTLSQWTEVGRLERLDEGTPIAATVGDTAVVVVRRGERVDVLADACSHLSGPLSGGTVETVGARPGDGAGVACIVCPWHGSAFALDSGAVVHGPATAPQPVFDVQVVDGVVSARVRTPERAVEGPAAHRRLGTVV